MFMKWCRTIGLFPFSSRGIFRPSLLARYLIPLTILSSMLLPQVAKTMVNNYYSGHKIGSLVRLSAFALYFLQMWTHSVLCVVHRRSFEQVATFMNTAIGYSWSEKYISHVGLAFSMVFYYWAIVLIYIINHFLGIDTENHIREYFFRYVAFTVVVHIILQYLYLMHTVALGFTRAARMLKRPMEFSDQAISNALEAIRSFEKVSSSMRTIQTVYSVQVLISCTLTLFGLESWTFYMIHSTFHNKELLRIMGDTSILLMLIGIPFCFCGTCEVVKVKVSTYPKTETISKMILIFLNTYFLQNILDDMIGN